MPPASNLWTMTQWGLDNLFNPGKRHMDDEKRRLQSTREEIGDNSGGRRIDLEGGTVSISVHGAASISVPTDDTDLTELAEQPEQPEGAGVLAAALEAEDLPTVALASDAEIEPDVVQEAEPPEVVPEVVEAKVEPELEPEPVAAPPAPRRRAVSASAWARQG